MTATHSPDGSDRPAIVPRWEWRTFGDRVRDNDALAFLHAEEAAESDELYVLSLWDDASVKVRDGVLDTKVLQRVGNGGLQLWVPIMKAAFPLAGDDLAAAFAALAVPPPTPPRPQLSMEEFLSELVGPLPDLRAVPTHKRRRRSTLNGCMIELTDITAARRTTWSVAVESPDPDLVARTVAGLGLAGRPNTCVAAGLKSLLDWGPSRFAVLDIGTNSVKFLIGQRHATGALETVAETAAVTRLGEGLTESGELIPTAIARTVDAIEVLVKDAREAGPVTIAAVGTAGLRQAPNRDTFLDAVTGRCGVVVEVISGTEEARLAYRAATSALPGSSAGGPLLVFDSGGGSSQFTFGTASEIEEQFSLDIGAVSVTERFGLADAVPRETVDAALSALERDFARLRDRPQPDMVIAIGGTSTNLTAHHHRLGSYDPDIVHGTVLDLAEVDRQIETFRSLSADGRRELPGLQPARAEVILAGACIVRTILVVTGQRAMTVSDRGLRHGVAIERFGPSSGVR